MNGKRARTLLVLFGIPLVAAACTSPSLPSTTKTIVSPATSEPTSPSSSQQLIGVTGSVCHVATTRVNLGLGGTAPDRVYVFSRFEYGKCQSHSVFAGVSADGGHVEAVSSRPVRCHPHCRLIATPDLNGDGASEFLAVGDTGFAAFFSLFVVERAPLTVSLLHGKHGAVPGFAVGGSDQSMWGLICAAGPTITSWGAGETVEGNGPYDVSIETYRLDGGDLVRMSGHTSLVRQGDPSLLPENGGVAFGAPNEICGAPLMPSN